MPANLENSAVATGLEKASFHSNPKERQGQRMFKLLHNCTHITRQQSSAQNSLSRLQQYVNLELADVQAGFRKGRGTRDQITNIRWIIEKARDFQKNIYAKAFDCGTQQTVENSERDGNTRPPYLPPEKSVCRSRNNS